MDSIVNLAVQKIGELVLQEAKFLHGVEDQVQSMQQELTMMNSFLIRIESIDEESGDERLRSTAKQIRRIAYDAEDVIDSYILGVVNQNKDLFKRYLSFCECLVNTHKVGTEIEDIKTRIVRTMEILKRYGGETDLTKVVGEGMSKAQVWRPASYSHVKEDHVVGLDEDVNKLVGSLTSKESQFQVLSIVGMGGSGKTTLIRKLYNHESIKQCFDSMVWVVISQQWVAQLVLLDIFKEASGEPMKLDEHDGLKQVGEKLYKYLESRKYLIVLDDVWTKRALEEIFLALPIKKDGSKIIVSTRFREVVDYPTLKVSIHEPRELTAEESWELFRKIALIDHGEETVSSSELAALEALAKEMLKKCKGLPLAVVALAGVLTKKKTLEEWEKFNVAMSSRLMETGVGTQTYGAVKEMLSLSYKDLPRDLKPCFLYLASFPEDYKIPTGQLFRMWIAEGFVSSENLHEGETLEDLAGNYLNELIDRCMVRVASRNYDGKAKKIEIHDLMRDLCIKKAKELEFLEIVSPGSSKTGSRVMQTRRTIVHSCKEDTVLLPSSLGNRHLRSLIIFREMVIRSFWSTSTNFHLGPVLKTFKLLRVLHLDGDNGIPKEIGRLIHLRYLGVINSTELALPSSIENLINLLTLDYRNESQGRWKMERIDIPNVLWKIEGLVNLYLPSNYGLSMEGELRLDTLKHLQTLWVRGGNWMLKELPQLSSSVQKIHIEGIESSEQLEAALQCPSIVLDRLRTLHINWGDCERFHKDIEEMNSSLHEIAAIMEGIPGEIYVNDLIEEFVGPPPGPSSKGKGDDAGKGKTITLMSLGHMINSRHLRKLALHGTIDDRSGSFQFPIGIKKLTLGGTKLEAERTLEALGRLPNLMVLHLQIESYMGTKWTCTKGMFSQLRELSMEDLPALEEWSIEMGAMCQLDKLAIGNCDNLISLPEGLKFITTLKKLDVARMPDGFCSKLRQAEGGEDAHIIQHIPVVKV